MTVAVVALVVITVLAGSWVVIVVADVLTDVVVVVAVVIAVVVTVVVCWAAPPPALLLERPSANTVPGSVVPSCVVCPMMPKIFWSPLESCPVLMPETSVEPRFSSRRVLPLDWS